MIRRRAERHIGLGGDGAVAEPRDAAGTDDPDRRIDDAVPSLGVVTAGHQCAPPALSTTTPAMISAMPTTFATPPDSPMKSTPMAATAAVPIPAQMA